MGTTAHRTKCVQGVSSRSPRFEKDIADGERVGRELAHAAMDERPVREWRLIYNGQYDLHAVTTVYMNETISAPLFIDLRQPLNSDRLVRPKAPSLSQRRIRREMVDACRLVGTSHLQADSSPWRREFRCIPLASISRCASPTLFADTGLVTTPVRTSFVYVLSSCIVVNINHQKLVGAFMLPCE
jgi:hypothetical protein